MCIRDREQWRLLRKSTASVLYESTKVMKDSMWSMLDMGEAKIAKISAYLS